MKRAPTDATLRSRAALYAAKLGQAARARTLTAEALALSPPTADLLFRAAVAAELGGSRDDALRYLEQSRLKGYPSHLVDQEPDLRALRRDRRYHQLKME